MQIPEEKDFPIFREIAIERDRGAALIAVGCLDSKLTDAIKSRLRDDKDTRHKLFKSAGPAGAFGTKIDLGYLLHIYGKETRVDLEAIGKIRNEFAHKPDPIDFGTDDIRKLCDGLAIRNRFWSDVPGARVFPRPLTKEDAREEFIWTCSLIINFLHHEAKKVYPQQVAHPRF